MDHFQFHFVAVVVIAGSYPSDLCVCVFRLFKKIVSCILWIPWIFFDINCPNQNKSGKKKLKKNSLSIQISENSKFQMKKSKQTLFVI